MRARLPLLLIAGLVLAATTAYLSLDHDLRAVLAAPPLDKDVLAWSQRQRDAAFRAMDRLPFLVKAHDIAPAAAPRPLPPGQPLDIPGLEAYIASQHLAALVILQDGKIRLERYGLGFSAQGRWTSFSVAKSFTSTLVGAALADGAIKSLDDTLDRYIPDLRGSAYAEVTVRQLLTMSSGVKWNEDYEDPNSDVSRFAAAKPDPGVDAVVSYMRKLPRAHPPGEVWHYNTGETNLIGVLVSSATGKPLARYMQEKIWQPAGMAARATWLLNDTGHEIAGCCIQAATRDFARFGLFVLAGGTPSVRPDWFADATRTQKPIGLPGRGYGYQWWTYDDGAFAADGIFGQGIYIDPARRLVIASNADWPHAEAGPEPEAREAFYRLVRETIDKEK